MGLACITIQIVCSSAQSSTHLWVYVVSMYFILLVTCMSGNFNITCHHCRHLFVIVTTDNSTEPSQIPDGDLVSYSTSAKMMYIAAVVHNMSGDEWQKMLVLGGGNVTELNDGSTTKKFYNAPLNRENTYFTFVRAYAYSHSDSVG